VRDNNQDNRAIQEDVTPQDVKNLSEPSRIILEDGQLVGFPKGTSQEVIDAVKPFFDAASSKFILSKIYFTKSADSDQFALYAISPEGKLFFSTVSQGDGPAQYSDFPISYDLKNNSWSVSGSYVSIEIPDGTLNAIWKNGFLQFVGGKKEATDDNTYYSEYLLNQSLATKSPWSKIPGVGDLVGDPDIKNTLDVNNYKIIDGNIDELRGDAWQAVSIPYEAGYIAYVEIHEGKVYGIDTANRAVVVRNDQTGEWEKFDRPVYGDDFDSYKSSFSSTTSEGKMTYKLVSKDFDLTDVEVKDINTLKDTDGTLVDWGYVKGSYSWKDLVTSESSPLPDILTKPYEFQIAGYFIGTADINIHSVHVWSDGRANTVQDGTMKMYVFEVPYKYSRQLILVQLPNVPDDQYRIAFGDIYDPNKSTIHNYLNNDFANLLESNGNTTNLRGKQIILDLEVGNLITNEGPINWKYISSHTPYDLNMPMLIGVNLFSLFQR
jgi:hypothetical protein